MCALLCPGAEMSTHSCGYSVPWTEFAICVCVCAAWTSTTRRCRWEFPFMELKPWWISHTLILLKKLWQQNNKSSNRLGNLPQPSNKYFSIRALLTGKSLVIFIKDSKQSTWNTTWMKTAQQRHQNQVSKVIIITSENFKICQHHEWSVPIFTACYEIGNDKLLPFRYVVNLFGFMSVFL